MYDLPERDKMKTDYLKPEKPISRFNFFISDRKKLNLGLVP